LVSEEKTDRSGDRQSGIPARRRDDIARQAADLDAVAISTRSHRLLGALLDENPELEKILRYSENEIEALEGIRRWMQGELGKSPAARDFYHGKHETSRAYEALEWKDFAAIRILDYIEHAGMAYVDLNLRGSHLLLSVDMSGRIVTDSQGVPAIRICNFELLKHIHPQ
jgi:hypothetical protein